MTSDPEKTLQRLADLRENAPEQFQGTLVSIEDSYEKKLWHQLTETLVEFFSEDETEGVRLGLFTNFVSTFSEKINQLKYVYLGLLVAEDLDGEL